MKQVDPNSYAYIIGQNIARIRKAQGLSQADMEQYGITRAYFGRIELGLHSLTLEKLILISRAFGLSPSDLLKDENGEDLL